ncbi:MAG TPA: ROK family protein, partial [Bacteroidales bacterium]|nr:ROK family protein [Bacteroidales bacterium]
DNGRNPSVFTLRKDKFYAVGVEVLFKRIQVNIINIDLKSEFAMEDANFELENTEVCRDKVVKFINEAIDQSGIKRKYIVGIGIGLTGRVNSQSGKSYNFFGFTDEPFAEYLSRTFEIPVHIENDTRVVGLAELVIGKVKNVSNTLIVNISRGIGMSIVANKKIVIGSSGFAGEFGHMQFVGNEGKLCICGKKGCLETEVSGKALENSLIELLKKGEDSLHFKLKDADHIRYDNIIAAANDGDLLPISLLQAQGEKLGAALGNIINLLNPEMIVIGGKYSKVGSFFLNSVRSGLYKTGLKDPLANCQITNSDLMLSSGNYRGCCSGIS